MLTKQFLSIYNEIDYHLWSVLWLSESEWKMKWFKDKIRECVHLKKGKVERKQYMLIKFGYIRNEIVHEYQDYVDVTEKTLQEMQSIRDYLINPPLCRDCKEVIHEVKTCNVSDSLKEVLGVMKQHQFTHIPVYKDQIFAWIVSDTIITDAISDLLTENWEIIAELDIGSIANKDTVEYTFVSQNTSNEDIIDLFAQAIQKKQKLWAVFITNLGSHSESLLWIVTAWDIPILEKYLI
jgi:predicted transcriptional regulator